jgi:hypothetical protein
MNKLKQLYMLGLNKSITYNNIVYGVEASDFELIRLRVDTGKGSFFISYSEQEESYSNANDEWSITDSKSWYFRSLHEDFEGFPPITPEEGIKFLKRLK